MGSPANQLTLTFSCGGVRADTKQFKHDIPPFDTGTWTFHYDREDQVATISCSSVTSFAQVDSVTLTAFGTNQPLRIAKGSQFPPKSNWRTKCHRNATAFVSSSRVRLVVEFSAAVVAPAATPPPKALAKPNTTSLNSQTPNDVVFFFPRTNRELWSNSTALKKASPYFDALLESGFEESETAARESPAKKEEANENDEVDSDDETDSIALSGVGVRQNSFIPAGVKEVVVKNGAYTTYRAVLTWIHFKHLDFAPLTEPTTSATPRKAALAARTTALAAATQQSDAPLPASPKSVYKLADMIGLPEVERLAINNFASQLTAENVLYQLTTDIATHAAMREALVNFATTNWATVRKAQSTKELTKTEVLEALPNPLVAASFIFSLAANLPD